MRLFFMIILMFIVVNTSGTLTLRILETTSLNIWIARLIAILVALLAAAIMSYLYMRKYKQNKEKERQNLSDKSLD